MTVAYVGLGSNQRDPGTQIDQAFAELDELPHTRLVKRSSLFRSAPLGYAKQPNFLNAVAQLETGMPAERLLAELHQIEDRHGRERPFPDAPRTLDLDLLLYGQLQLNSEKLTLPHPRMHERAFVLRPLLEIDPAANVPGYGPAGELLKRCQCQDVERVA
jgi:2-amino-4-hydroxy-6-hydroxymethyldihydropteridine diphosphokinase